ncbi:MAG: glycosyltransferase family 4 protein, partial [Actinobacteria bacterium]|nr:glycosyltransferase family 4 protein [Actinomycetota bacterium]
HLQGLQRAGVEVRVIAPHDAGLPLEHEVGGVAVRRVRYGRDRHETIAYRGEMHQLVRSPAGAWRALRLVTALARATRQELDRWGPDVLDVHWLVPGGIAARLAALPDPHLRVPVQLDVHGTDVALVGGGGLAEFVGRRAVAGADAVAAMSFPLAEELVRVLGRSADAVLPMPGAPAPPATERPLDGPVLAIGRLVPEKGHADLVDAVGFLRAGGRDLRLVVVGDGPERDRLTERAADAEVPLTLPGARSPQDLEAHYRDATIVVVPSHREGFGLVAAEALARRRPVVAAATGGLREIVDATTGWPVPPADPPALAGAIAEILDDPAEADRRTLAGARRVEERWSPDALGRRAAAQLAATAARRRR